MLTSLAWYLTLLNSNSKLQFKAVFSSFEDVKVIQFSSMQDAFLGFTDKASLFIKLQLLFFHYFTFIVIIHLNISCLVALYKYAK